jgi:hypothetical protein
VCGYTPYRIKNQKIKMSKKEEENRKNGNFFSSLDVSIHPSVYDVELFPFFLSSPFNNIPQLNNNRLFLLLFLLGIRKKISNEYTNV